MTVLNKYRDVIPTDAIYIGRGSKWGNPFVIDAQNSREVVCEKYREYLQAQITKGVFTPYDLAQLYGKDLVCFCAPKQCHGDILEEVAKEAVAYLNRIAV